MSKVWVGWGEIRVSIHVPMWIKRLALKCQVEFFCKKGRGGEFQLKTFGVRRWGGVGVEEGRFWIRSAAPMLSGPVEPPSGSGFGVNMGPVDPFLPQGTQTPGFPTFHFYFPGCKTPLAIRAGGVFLFFF